MANQYVLLTLRHHVKSLFALSSICLFVFFVSLQGCWEVWPLSSLNGRMPTIASVRVWILMTMWRWRLPYLVQPALLPSQSESDHLLLHTRQLANKCIRYMLISTVSLLSHIVTFLCHNCPVVCFLFISGILLLVFATNSVK